MVDTFPLNTPVQRGGNDPSGCAALQAAGDPQPHERSGVQPIPNELLRALNGICRFIATCGSDQGERLSRLRDEWSKMSPSSRESTRQLLDFMLGVLVPLRQGMPGKKRKL